MIERGSAGSACILADNTLLSVLRSCPGLPVVRLEAGGAVAVLTSRTLPVAHIDDLVQWIASAAGG